MTFSGLPQLSLKIFSCFKASKASISEKKRGIVQGVLTHHGRRVRDKGRAEGTWHQVTDP